jgi:hypothetical protein
MMQQRFLWFGLVFSTLLYGILAYATQRNFRLQPIEMMLRRPLVIIVYAIAVVIFFAASAITSRTMQRFTLQLALFDAVAIIGLLAAMLARDWRLYLPAWVLALIGFVRVFPGEVEASSWRK